MSSRRGLVWQSSPRASAAPLVQAGPGFCRTEAREGFEFPERCQRLAQEAEGEGCLGGHPLGPPEGEPAGRRPGASNKARFASPASPIRNRTEYSLRRVASTVAETAASAASRSNSATSEGPGRTNSKTLGFGPPHKLQKRGSNPDAFASPPGPNRAQGDANEKRADYRGGFARPVAASLRIGVDNAW